MLDIIKVESCVNNDCQNNAGTHLWDVRQVILHAERWLRIRRISTMVIYRSQPSPYEGDYIRPFSTAPQRLRGGADFLLRVLDDLCDSLCMWHCPLWHPKSPPDGAAPRDELR